MIKLTPSELIEKYPAIVKKWNWDTQFLGQLLKYQVLEGTYNRTNRISLIDENSFIEFTNFLNLKIEERKIDFNE